jgi:hypothetical protein
MTAAEAEPPPERNHLPPSIDDMMPLEMVQEFLELDDLGGSFATGSLAAGVYGAPPGMRPRARAGRATPYHRPNTGYVMRFPVEPAGQWGEVGHEAVPAGGETREHQGEFMGGLAVHVEAVDALTLHTMGDVGAMPAEVVNALLNVPNVSLSQWHAMRTRQRTQRAREPQAPRSAAGTVRSRNR